MDGERVGQATMIAPEPDREIYDFAPAFVFEKTDQPKTHKNRLHVDLGSRDLDGDCARLEKLGATVLRWDDDHVMQDPEGNEFCLT